MVVAIFIDTLPTVFDKIFHRIIEMPQNFQETDKAFGPGQSFDFGQ